MVGAMQFAVLLHDAEDEPGCALGACDESQRILEAHPMVAPIHPLEVFHPEGAEFTVQAVEVPAVGPVPEHQCGHDEWTSGEDG